MSIRSLLLSSVSLTLTTIVLAGCPHVDDDHTGDEAGFLDAYSIYGTVVRDPSATPTGDGVGTLYIAALEECALGSPLVAAAVVPDADLSSEDAAVEFELPDLAPDEVHLALFLDDDLDADPMMPIPGSGDLVYADVAGDGVLSCVAITVDDEDVEDVELVLNVVAP